jgi:hypothetical protein
MSNPVFVVSVTASAVVLINAPVVYPKIDNICNINGFTTSTPEPKSPPSIESKFIPKREKINNTNRIIINAFCMFNTPKMFVGPLETDETSIGAVALEAVVFVSIIIYNYIIFAQKAIHTHTHIHTHNSPRLEKWI